jgi:hypothetical protein
MSKEYVEKVVGNRWMPNFLKIHLLKRRLRIIQRNVEAVSRMGSDIINNSGGADDETPEELQEYKNLVDRLAREAVIGQELTKKYQENEKYILGALKVLGELKTVF